MAMRKGKGKQKKTVLDDSEEEFSLNDISSDEDDRSMTESDNEHDRLKNTRKTGSQGLASGSPASIQPGGRKKFLLSLCSRAEYQNLVHAVWSSTVSFPVAHIALCFDNRCPG